MALTPDGVKELVKKGAKVLVQSGAGSLAHYDDPSYQTAGAELVSDSTALLSQADFVLMVSPTEAELPKLKQGACIAGSMNAVLNKPLVDALNKHNLNGFAMELMPRITRAQSMDVLSSMSTITGYKAVLAAASALPRFFPMLSTAAGTITPAKAFVIGAGVAGLQAIATCKRLGAKVQAFDVRPAVKEQIESLGAQFVHLEMQSGEGEGQGGYAKELSEDTHKRELELIGSTLEKVDVCITTALIPGKPAPILITRDMLPKMKPGSVIVDLAAPNGGNCEATKPGETVEVDGVTIIGRTDFITGTAFDASKMYSKNFCSFLDCLLEEGNLNLEKDPEIVKGTLVTQNGQIVHDFVKQALQGGAA